MSERKPRKCMSCNYVSTRPRDEGYVCKHCEWRKAGQAWKIPKNAETHEMVETPPAVPITDSAIKAPESIEIITDDTVVGTVSASAAPMPVIADDTTVETLPTSASN